MRKHQAQAGFVLLTVLVLLTLAALALTGLARQSILLALEAAEAQRDLQRRWGVISAERAILWRANATLERAALRQRYLVPQDGDLPRFPEPDHVTASALLGGVRFTLRLADEDAKLNLNALYLRYGGDRIVPLLHGANRSSYSLPVLLRPQPKDDPLRLLQPFDSWGQVFALDRPVGDQPVPQSLAEATEEVTCWGQGRLNLQRAPDRLVELLCRQLIGENAVRKLLELRAESQEIDLDKLIDGLELRQRQRFAIAQLLTTTSACYSLWITVDDQHRRRFTLCVAEPRTNTEPVIRSFTW